MTMDNAQTEAPAAQEATTSSTSQTPDPQPNVEAKPDEWADYEAKLDSVPAEKAEAFMRKLLKKNPIKAKSGKDEFTVDDFDKVKRSVSLDKHFNKIGEQLKAEKEEMARNKEALQRFVDGDPDITRHILRSRPKVAAQVAAALREQYEAEEKYKGMDPQTRALAEEAETYKAKFAELQQQQQQRQAEAQRLEEERLYEATRAEMEQYMVSVLTAGGIPQTLAPFAVRRLAPMVEQNQALGSPLSPAQLAAQLRENIFEEQRAVFNLEGEELLGMVGEDVAKKIGRAMLARMKGGIVKPEPVQEHKETVRKEPTNQDQMRNLFRDLRDKYGVNSW
jgi:hypothetical protein